MKTLRVAQDGTTCHTNAGHQIVHDFCQDESELFAQNVLHGLRRADAEQRVAATGTSDYEDDSERDEYLPSEIFLG